MFLYLAMIDSDADKSDKPDICPCHSSVHMVGENESQNEKWRMK